LTSDKVCHAPVKHVKFQMQRSTFYTDFIPLWRPMNYRKELTERCHWVNEGVSDDCEHDRSD